MSDVWTREFGSKQGRIAPSGASPLAGTQVFCLGFDRSKRFDEIQPGDFAEVSQENTFTAGTKIFRAPVEVRPPAATPTGTKWVVQLLIDEKVYAEHVLVAGGVTRKRVLSANVSKLAGGNHVVTLRLQFLNTNTDQFIVMANSIPGGG